VIILFGVSGGVKWIIICLNLAGKVNLALTRACIKCNGLLRVSSIRCRICGSEDPFGNKMARKRAALLHGLAALSIFTMIFLVVYEILPIITIYLHLRG
jgi:hypothetical protein